MSYETEKTFSLNPCKGFKGKMEVNGKDVYISGVEKITRDGSRKWLQVMADDLSFAFSLNDSKYDDNAYFGKVDIDGQTFSLKAALREGSNGVFISGWQAQEKKPANNPPPKAAKIDLDSIEEDIPF